MQGNATRSVAPESDVEVMAHSAGHGTSTAFSVKPFVDSDTGTPSFTSASAARRLAGVIRLSVPSSSSLPHRPQLDSDDCQVSNCASVTRGRSDDSWETPSPESAAAMPMVPTRIETALRIAALMMPPGVRLPLCRAIFKERTAKDHAATVRSEGVVVARRLVLVLSTNAKIPTGVSGSSCEDVLRFTTACQHVPDAARAQRTSRVTPRPRKLWEVVTP